MTSQVLEGTWIRRGAVTNGLGANGLNIHVSGTKLLRIHPLAPETEPGFCSIIDTIEKKADLN